jgi:hypothetical protein
MALLDRLTDVLAKIVPSKQQSSASGAIGTGGHGMVPFEDDVSSGFQSLLIFNPWFSPFYLLQPYLCKNLRKQ